MSFIRHRRATSPNKFECRNYDSKKNFFDTSAVEAVGIVLFINAAIWRNNTMEFFNQAITVLQTLVVAIGAGLGVWGVVNLMEG